MKVRCLPVNLEGSLTLAGGTGQGTREPSQDYHTTSTVKSGKVPHLETSLPVTTHKTSGLWEHEARPEWTAQLLGAV